MTPAGTSNALDVQNEWEENTHTHTHMYHDSSSTVIILRQFNQSVPAHKIKMSREDPDLEIQ